MNPDYLEQLERPSSSNLEALLETATDSVEEQLAEFGADGIDDSALRKMACAYYYDWEEDDPNYVFLLKDPGSLNQRHTNAVRRLEALPEDYDPRSLVDIYRGLAKTWFTDTRNSDFMRRFLSLCRTNDLISFDSYWGDYVNSNEFFDDFYMTDIIKYRAPGSAVGSPEVDIAFREQLRPELEAIDPDLIFAFGNRAWNPVREKLQAEPVEETDIDESKITQLHGHLHRTKSVIDTHVLPLGHMSTQFYGAQLSKQKYMSRLEKGLQQWQRNRH